MALDLIRSADAAAESEWLSESVFKPRVRDSPTMLHIHPMAPGAKFLDRLGHLHLHLPELHEHPPTHHESIYFEAGRMSREMEHL